MTAGELWHGLQMTSLTLVGFWALIHRDGRVYCPYEQKNFVSSKKVCIFAAETHK
jgi:hypothetical protein